MKRKRPLLYEVLGAARRTAGAPGAPADIRPRRRREAPPRPRRRRREIRLSHELAAVIGLVVLVSVATSYYLGTLGGRAAGGEPRLSTRLSREAPPPGAPEPEARTGYAVQVLTRRWPRRAGPRAVSEKIVDVVRFLRAQGYPRAWATKNDADGVMVVYAAWSPDRRPLQGICREVRKLSYEGRLEFRNALIASAVPPPPPPR